MTSDSYVTVVGTLVTLLGMAVTIKQASQARNYRNQIKLDVRKINLVNVTDGLKRAQDEIRRLPTSSQPPPRGIRPVELIQKVREQFDNALGTLNSAGPDTDARSLLVEAQSKLNAYEISLNSGSPSAENVHELQAKMQDAVSILSTKINQMEGKA